MISFTEAEREALLHAAANNALLFNRKPQKGGDRDKFELWAGIADKFRAYVPDADPEALIKRPRARMQGIEFMNPNRPAMMKDVERLNRRLGHEKATDAIRAGHGNEYLALLLAWDFVYGKPTDHEAREGNAPEHSGAPVVPGAVEPNEPPLGHAFVYGRGEPEAAGEAGAGRVSDDQAAHSPDGSGDGGSGSVQSPPDPPASSDGDGGL